MESVSIKLLTLSDIDQLFEFEKENRVYFKNIGLPRIDEYYNYNFFVQIVKELVCEQDKGMHYMYTVVDSGKQFVGKYNQYMLQHGKWIDSLLFEKILD
ncbi:MULTISPECIES: hypothetical protein [unclassified Sedimentibacter]|uniref:hypothetical protein n=1 Tax=unclassified Sedimentibacter TaxID=2649220 RepID=UPI0027DEC980|nr:hypothetical protein [Sedimentibacter sp. MB35-C1]WMJ77457.1 hypothetical protein RBQ61_00570 [Sedimentibacter sp. MB35-C1]